jgi:hypothetical protein
VVGQPGRRWISGSRRDARRVVTAVGVRNNPLVRDGVVGDPWPHPFYGPGEAWTAIRKRWVNGSRYSLLHPGVGGTQLEGRMGGADRLAVGVPGGRSISDTESAKADTAGWPLACHRNAFPIRGTLWGSSAPAAGDVPDGCHRVPDAGIEDDQDRVVAHAAFGAEVCETGG